MKIACAAASVLLAAAPAAAQAAPQALTIVLHGNAAVTQALQRYAAGSPIAVRVTAAASAGAALEGVDLAETSPGGEAQRTPLARENDGSFSGTMTLDETGAWKISVRTHSGTVTTDSAPVLLNVEPAVADTSWLVGLAVGGGLFLVGIGGFLRLRRRPAARESEPVRAA